MSKRDRALVAARETLDWVASSLSRYAEGVHRFEEPAYVLDSELPTGLAEAYRRWDGFELFHESLQIWPSRRVQREASRSRDPGRSPDTREGWRVGVVEGDDLLVDRRGRVWRHQEDEGELICDGSSFERWLAGFVAAEAVVYQPDGEFQEGVHDEDGELSADAAIAREQAVLKRDRRAPGPRWRLARLLARQGRIDEAREHLEDVVDGDEGFAWAWFDLARISESFGELESACDEYRTAAEACAGALYCGYFWSQLARVARLRGDEVQRLEAAGQALAASPQLVRDQLAGARESAAEGDLAAARELAETARSLAPRDLDVIDLLRRLDSGELDGD